MHKIFVKQIAIAGAGNLEGLEFQELYLDNYGRVWYQVKEGEQTVWRQLDLPEDPTWPNGPEQ